MKRFETTRHLHRRTDHLPVLLVLSVMLCASTAAAVTHDVYTREELTTLIGINIAEGSAADGDRIHIHGPGPYFAPSGGWWIRRSLEILGDGAGEDFDYSGNGASSTVLRPSSVFPGNGPVFVIDLGETPTDGSLENIYIHDLQISQEQQPTSVSPNCNGIYFHSTSNKYLKDLRLERLSIRWMGNDGIHIVSPEGQYASTGITITDCNLFQNEGDGIEILSSTECNLISGICRGNGKYGASLKACLPVRIMGMGFEVNCANQSVDDLAQLLLQSCHGFVVDGGHFEGFDVGYFQRAIYVAGSESGTIQGNSFGTYDQSGTIGIDIAWEATSGIFVGPNWFSGTDVAVNIADDDSITGCTIMPQGVNHLYATNAKIVVPETTDRGHFVMPNHLPSSNITAGLAFPKLSAAKRNAMTSAASGGSRRDGLVIYNGDRHRLQHWDGTRWLEEVSAVAGPGVDTTIAVSIAANIDTSAATRILTLPPSGSYRVSVYSTVTTSFTHNQAQPAVKVLWYGEGALHSRQLSFAQKPQLGAEVHEVIPLHITGGQLQYQVSGYQSGSGAISLRIRVEALP